MIHVIAAVELKPGASEVYLEKFRANVAKVKAEDGCIAYGATVDVDSGIPIQVGPRENVVTIVEQWESLDALHAHLKTPHMAAYQKQTQDLVASVSLQVLKPV